MLVQKLYNEIRVENVVTSTSVDQELDLDSMAMDLSGVKYDPEQFPGLVYRTQHPKSTSLVFRSGNIVCTGASSIESAEEVLQDLYSTFSDLGIDTGEFGMDVQNVVISADLGDALNLNAIAIGLGLEKVEYEPEQFPGLVYRPEDLDVVTLLFGSGKVVITGGTTEDAGEQALDVIVEELDALGLFTLNESRFT